MRFGKRALHLLFAKAIEDRATEHKTEHRDGEDDPTKAKARVGRQPPQWQLPAMLHCLTSAAQGAANDRENFTLVVTPAPHRQLSARALALTALPQFARAVGSLLATAGRGFLDGLFDRFPGFAGALLNAAQQFIMLAFGALEIVIRELGPLLFQLALGDVPVAFNFECVHNNMLCFSFVNRRQRDGKNVLAAGLSAKTTAEAGPLRHARHTQCVNATRERLNLALDRMQIFRRGNKAFSPAKLGSGGITRLEFLGARLALCVRLSRASGHNGRIRVPIQGLPRLARVRLPRQFPFDLFPAGFQHVLRGTDVDGDRKSGDALAQAMRGFFGQVSGNDAGVHIKACPAAAGRPGWREPHPIRRSDHTPNSGCVAK